LQLQKNELANFAHKSVGHVKPIKLVAMDGQMALAAVFPCVFLIDRYAHQVRHDFSESVVMISFDPDDLDAMAWIGEFADVSEELPVLLGEATKIQVGKDIAQQNQPLKVDRLQKSKRSARLADVGTQVQVRDDNRVKAISLHAPYL